jgi:hypothetical protein
VRLHFGYFDLFPDGHLGPDAELGYRIDPASLFPRLPADASEAKRGWAQHDERMGHGYRYSSLRSEPGGWTFRAECVGPENKIYGMTVDNTFHLGAARGAVRRIEQEYTQEYGFKGKGTGAVELTSAETRDAAWLGRFAPATERYFAASKAYEHATREAAKDAGKSKTLLADAKAALQAARDAIDEPILREQLDSQLARHDSMASYYADSAQRRAEVVGKPAADWELEGLDGKTHTLAGYRGKVVCHREQPIVCHREEPNARDVDIRRDAHRTWTHTRRLAALRVRQGPCREDHASEMDGKPVEGSGQQIGRG